MRRHKGSPGLRRGVLALASALVLAGGLAESAAAGTVPAGFTETTAFSGLTNPTVVRFAPDGRVFVAEKSGLIKVFDGPADTTASVYADLRTQVHNFWDRGLLGMALNPYWSEYPWIYVLYTRDAEPGGTPPRWGTAGSTSDGCPTPPGPTSDGCVATGRLSVLTPRSGGGVDEQPLINDWCQQYPSHSVGSLEFGPWNAMYASAGDGASFVFADWGQDGDPVNPCGDPPGGIGSTLTPPNAEGGALRSQDLLTPSDPTGLDGTIIRVDPRTGNGLDYNPYATSTDPNARRIIASGLRNPFRFAIDNNGELWTGDVGWTQWEEINRLPETASANFGWPCFEGNGREYSYDASELSLCESLYSSSQAKAPYFTYQHSAQVVPGETCPSGSSSIAGMEFNYDSLYPSRYSGALFFADYSRDCIWAMRTGSDGRPSPSSIETFDAGASNPVFLEMGPDGALYYADFDGGRIQRIGYGGQSNQPPTAVITSDRTSGAPPLTVQFNGTGSSDPDAGDTLSYAWDLDADGAFDDSTASTPSFTYTQSGSYAVRLRVTDTAGATSVATITIDAGNSPPTPTITSPTPALLWSVGDRINFQGSAMDPEDGALPPSALSWSLVMEHCPSNCHSHTIQSWVGAASGGFNAPDHEYPSHLVLSLTATDSRGVQATRSVRLDPRTVSVTLKSKPGSLTLGLNNSFATAPLSRSVIRGSTTTLSAAQTQSSGGRSFTFKSWSDGGAATHTVKPLANASYTATYSR